LIFVVELTSRELLTHLFHTAIAAADGNEMRKTLVLGTIPLRDQMAAIDRSDRGVKQMGEQFARSQFHNKNQ
jgi:hypothetical protein